MGAGVILDTSYLITLADPSRVHHDAARRYWRYFTENAIPMFIPTIVVSEFCVKQQLPPEILRNCIVHPFNWADAIMAASLETYKQARDNVSRDALKDDLKIISQAIVVEAEWVITDDSSTFYKFARVLVGAGKATFRPIQLSDGFDLSLLDAQGQGQLRLGDGCEEEDV